MGFEKMTFDFACTKHLPGINTTTQCICNSPVFYCILDGLPQVSGFVIIQKRYLQEILKCGCSHCCQSCQPLSNREFKYFPYVHPEICIRILQ